MGSSSLVEMKNTSRTATLVLALLATTALGQRAANMNAWLKGEKGDSSKQPIQAFPLEAYLKTAANRCSAMDCPDFSQELFRVLDRDLSGSLDKRDISSIALGLKISLA